MTTEQPPAGPCGHKAHSDGMDHDIRRDELVEMIEAGYGDMPQPEIPPDWKTRPGPQAQWFHKW